MNKWCKVLGHKMRTVGEGITAPQRCIRDNCGHMEPGFEWPSLKRPESHRSALYVMCERALSNAKLSDTISNCDTLVRNIERTFAPQWIPTDQYDTIGWCWIKYKGEARHAWYNGDDLYKFTRHGHNGWYMTECISGVIAIEVPEL
ncbi:MAG: hypothetical protein JRJ62_00265 [Deltaproteobacteria bacterium]|nr:hypothetical protein [Deltaproteobacteria bacterium]